MCPTVLKDRSICLDGDIGEILSKLLQKHQ